MQMFFLFENARPQKNLGTGTRGAHNQAEAVMPLTDPGQPLLAAIPPGRAGEDPGRRCDGTLGSPSNRQIPPRQPGIALSFWGGMNRLIRSEPQCRAPVGISVSLLHCVCEHLFAGQTTMAPNEEGSRLVRHQGKARAVDDD